LAPRQAITQSHILSSYELEFVMGSFSHAAYAKQAFGGITSCGSSIEHKLLTFKQNFALPSTDDGNTRSYEVTDGGLEGESAREDDDTKGNEYPKGG